MKIIRKYTAIRIFETTVDHIQIPKFEYDQITGPYYSEEYPKIEFDSEDDAITYAHKNGKYHKWMIVPIIKFDNF